LSGTFDALPPLIARHATRIDHIAVAVHELEAAMSWYRLLGFEVAERRHTRGERTGMLSAVMHLGPVVFVLTQGTSPESQVARFVAKYGPGVSHVAIEVHDAAAVYEDLRAKGVGFATELLRGGGIVQAFTRRDPRSGVMIELIQRVGGDFSDDSVERLFRVLEANDEF
jgi:methylmalonyl-CoA epimerase